MGADLSAGARTRRGFEGRFPIHPAQVDTIDETFAPSPEAIAHGPKVIAAFAASAGAKTVGLNIMLPHEQYPNPYITPELCFQFHYFAMRKMHFLKRARGLAAFPGGFGTLDELFEAITLIQTNKIDKFPIILVGREFWGGLIDWIRTTLFDNFQNISDGDIDLVQVVDTEDEVIEILDKFYDEYNLSPNF